MKNTFWAILVVLFLTGSLYGCSSNSKPESSKEFSQNQTQEIKQNEAQEKTNQEQKTESSQGNEINPSQTQALNYAFKTFILWVPGTSYTVDNYDNNTSTLYTSSGTLPKSTLMVNTDGTYIWNSAWDEKIINGKWTQDSDGLSLNLINGQEGKTWKLIKSDGQSEDIFIMDGSIWYSGKSVTLKEK